MREVFQADHLENLLKNPGTWVAWLTSIYKTVLVAERVMTTLWARWWQVGVVCVSPGLKKGPMEENRPKACFKGSPRELAEKCETSQQQEACVYHRVQKLRSVLYVSSWGRGTTQCQMSHCETFSIEMIPEESIKGRFSLK